MKHKYGEFSQEQMQVTKEKLRKKIFYLLVACENEMQKKELDKTVSVDEAFTDVLNEINGLNDLLGCPPEIVDVMSLLNSARIEYKNPDFSFAMYRKLVLDAGNQVQAIKEV